MSRRLPAPSNPAPATCTKQLMQERMARPSQRAQPADDCPVLLEGLESRRLLSATAVAAPLAALVMSSASSSDVVSGYSPDQVSQAYGFHHISASASPQAAGSGQTIAIVNAFDDPAIASDLHQFDQRFNLPDPPSLAKVNQSGGSQLPPVNSQWALETALDVEWAHALAPGANIALVEANSPTINDLTAAVDTARHLPGVSVVSMSWGAEEFAGQTALDGLFTTPAGHGGVTFIAASGDSGAGAVEWPGTSANVLAVGGTTLITLDANRPAILETAWSGASSGVSALESGTPEQSSLTGMPQRVVPDVAFDADPRTGFAVYDSVPNQGSSGWEAVGGTSAGAPQWAALIAIANQQRSAHGESALDGATGTIPSLYQNAGLSFRAIAATLQVADTAPSGTYAPLTGLGSPRAPQIVQSLVAGPSGAIAAPPPAAPTPAAPRRGKHRRPPPVHPSAQPFVLPQPPTPPFASGPVNYSGAVQPVQRHFNATGSRTFRFESTPPIHRGTYAQVTALPAAPVFTEVQVRQWLLRTADAVAGWATAVPQGLGELVSADPHAPLLLLSSVGYRFAPINLAATFSDTLAGFINECASLPAETVATAAAPSHERAWAVTFAVLAADVVMVRYALYRRNRTKRSAITQSLKAETSPGADGEDELVFGWGLPDQA